MSGIIEKLGSYQILTNLLPGAFFILTLNFFFGLTLPTENFGDNVVAYYFIGLIINRIGSLIIEPVLKKLGFVEFAPYSDFTKASKSDPKIDTLSEMNNYTRSLLTCVLLLPAIQILQVMATKWTWLSSCCKWTTIALLFILFLFSYRKQTSYVRKRVEAVNRRRTQDNVTKADI